MLKPLACTIGLCGLVACQDAMGPDRGDPAQYALSGFEFVCAAWQPNQPSANLGLFDISFPPTLIDGSLNSTKGGAPPSDDERHVILALGGTIVHAFQVPIIRTILPVNNIPRLFRSPVAQGGAAKGISDPNDLNLYGSIGYSRPISVADTTLLRALGVQITSVTPRNSMGGIFPDSAIRVLRARPEVLWVEAILGGCNHVDL